MSRCATNADTSAKTTIDAIVSRAIWNTSQPFQTGSSEGAGWGGSGDSGNDGAPGSGHGFWKEDTGRRCLESTRKEKLMQSVKNLSAQRSRGKAPRPQS